MSAMDATGATCLHSAVKANSPEMVEYLRKFSNSHPTAKDNNQMS
jgi:ankyrin repeat protein